MVDDEPLMARAIGRLLVGHAAEVVTDPAQALARLRAQAYALVLCDLRMPGITGAELFGVMQAEDPAQAERFVFMTGGRDDAKYADFLEAVDNLVLDKPFSPDALDAVLARFGLTEPDPEP